MLPDPGGAQLKDMYVILFEDKLIIAKEDPNDANTEINIMPWVQNQHLLSELIFDCAAGLFPCSPLEYAVMHTGNIGVTLDAAAQAALAKEYQDSILGDGAFDAFKDESCVAINYLDESDLAGQKKIMVLCDDPNTVGLGEFLQGLSPTVFDYNMSLKGLNIGSQNTVPLRAMRVKAQDVNGKIQIGHLIIYKNRIAIYGNIDEMGLKEKLQESYYTHMLQLRDTATAFSFNNDDGFCIKIERDLAQAFNICTEIKKLRDIVMLTIYNQYLLYKAYENLQVMADANMDCPAGVIDSHISALFKGIQDLSQMETTLPGFKPNLEQSVKFILDILNDKFKPLTLTGEAEAAYTKTIKNLQLTDCTASLAGLAAPYSFIQKKMNVYKRSRSINSSFVQNKASLSTENKNRFKMESQLSSTSSVSAQIKNRVGNKSGVKVQSQSKTESHSESKNKSKVMLGATITAKTAIKTQAQNKTKLTSRTKSMITSEIRNKSLITSMSSKSKSKTETEAESSSEAELEMRTKEGEEIDKTDPDQDLKSWHKKLTEGQDKYDSIPTPDIRMPNFDRSKCKEGQDTFQCMSEFLARIYNRYKCNKRLLKAFYGNQLQPTEMADTGNELTPLC